jgi:hypothetical protein
MHHRGLEHNLSSQCENQEKTKTTNEEKARANEATMGEDIRRNKRVCSKRSRGLVTLPPGLYKARQRPLSHHSHHLVNTPNQSRATQHRGHRVLRASRPEPV